MTRLLDNMERQHLVVRIAAKRDRRTNLSHLTKTGRELEGKARFIANKTLKEALQGLTLEAVSYTHLDVYKRQGSFIEPVPMVAFPRFVPSS